MFFILGLGPNVSNHLTKVFRFYFQQILPALFHGHICFNLVILKVLNFLGHVDVRNSLSDYL